MLLKKCLLALVCLCLSLPSFGVEALYRQAKTGEDRYEDALLVYGAANACLATYDDKVGNTFYRFIQEDGWRVKKYELETKTVDSGIFLVSRYNEKTDEDVYLLTFRGTENSKDVDADMRMGKVLFGGSTPSEIRITEQKTEFSDTAPTVHKGFLDYTLATFSLKTDAKKGNGMQYLYEIIKNDPKARLVVSGHSLGGAMATLYAACLLEMGVPEDRITVVNFGAPAVGNKAFSDKYANRINLLRVYSHFDPVPGSLQSVRRGYVQFGRTLTLTADARYKTFQHSMENYADLAGKHFYDVRKREVTEKTIPGTINTYDSGTGPVVAVIVSCSPDTGRMPDFYYVHNNMLDIYRKNLLRYRIVEQCQIGIERVEAQEMAKSLGADYLLLANIDVHRDRTSLGWIVALTQNVFKVKDGALVAGTSFSSKIKSDASIFQASAYNAFRSVEELAAPNVALARPLPPAVE